MINTNKKTNPHRGSTLDEFLEEEGFLQEEEEEEINNGTSSQSD